MSSPKFIHYQTPEQGFLKKTYPQRAKRSLPIFDSTNGSRNPPGEHQAYQNEAVCSLCLRSFQRPEDLAQHLIEHSASFPLLSDRPEDDSSQNSRSVQRRPNRPNSRKKAKREMLKALAEPSSRTVQSGATGDFQSVRTLQVQNASLQRQLGHVSGRFLCPVCPNSYTRNDRLYDHIVHEQEERHQRVAAKIREPRCLACGQKFKRKTEVVKHELTTCKMNYRSRAEGAYASLFLDTASDNNYQPDTSIHPTHKAQVLNTLEPENATSSANLESASGISGINISTGGGSSTEQGGLNSYAQIEGSKDPMNTFSTWSAEPNHFFTQASGSQEPNSSLGQTGGSKDPMDTFSTWSAEPNRCFTQAVYEAPISTHSSGSQEPNSSWAQAGGSKDPMDTFSTWSAEPNHYFTQAGYGAPIGTHSSGSQEPNSSWARAGGSKDPMDTFSTWSAEPNHCFTQAGYGAPINTHSSGSREPNSSWAQAGGSKDPMDTFSICSGEPSYYFTQAEYGAPISSGSQEPHSSWAQAGGSKDPTDTFSIRSGEPNRTRQEGMRLMNGFPSQLEALNGILDDMSER